MNSFHIKLNLDFCEVFLESIWDYLVKSLGSSIFLTYASDIDELDKELNVAKNLRSVRRSLENELVQVQVLQKRTSSYERRSFVQFF